MQQISKLSNRARRFWGLKFSVRTKILSGFVLVFILCLSVLLYCIVQMRQILVQLTIVEEGYLPVTRDAARIENDQQNMERYLDPDRLLSRDRVPGNLYLPLLVFHLNRIEEGVKQAQQRITDALNMPGADSEKRALTIIRDQLRQIETEYEVYRRLSREFLTLIEKGDLETARARMTELREQTVRFSRAIRNLTELLDQRIEAAVDITRERQERAGVMVLALSGAAIVFGVLMIFVTHLVLRPISRLIQGVKSIAGGDYGQRVAIESEDEIGTLAREFNVMATSLEERNQSLRQSQLDLEQAYEALKQAHGHLKTLSLYNESIIHSIEVGLLVCDREGKITTINRAGLSLWCVTPAQVIRTHLDDVPELQPVASYPQQVITSGTLVRHDGVEFRTTDGAAKLVDYTCLPLLDDFRLVQGVIILGEDVTERSRTKQRLIQSERLALIGRMSAQVTHEIRNPLNSLGLNAEMLEDELSSLDHEHRSDAWQLLKLVAKEIDRLTEITESYLRLARLPTPQLERENVGTIVENLLRFLSEELSQKHIALDAHISADLPTAMVDDNQLRQALLNIVRNSCEAMSAGGRLEVNVTPQDEGVEITIRDQGEGIDPAMMSRIFDPFYSTKASGTGLGLPITQQIILEHGGQLVCESDPGAGTVFRITLPSA